MPTLYSAPAVAGDIEWTVGGTDPAGRPLVPGTGIIWVGVKGLKSLIPAADPAIGQRYALIGQDDYHPKNHYLKPEAIGRLQQLAYLYRRRFPNDPPLHLNDAGPERGGLFDIYWENPQKGTKRTVWWTPPHHEHRRRTVIDIRANDAPGAIPVRNWTSFLEIASRLGIEAAIHSPGTSNQHYHLRLMGVAE